MKKFLLLVLVCFSVTACSAGTKIDASSDESMGKSIAAIMEELEPSEQTQFQAALRTVMFSDVTKLIGMMAMGQDVEVTKAQYLAKIDGKTAKEVIQIAKSMKKNSKK